MYVYNNVQCSYSVIIIYTSVRLFGVYMYTYFATIADTSEQLDM